ncbi:hypothetical protein Leryth_014577 [Lithospermum erythrorhizon]|nr:hypothetical protein Leryth_014577 [Lithospermum erythrorhizon]
MERFAQRGGELFGNGTRPQKSFENSMSTRYNDSDIDFDDVFGGPPRRYSMQEVQMRYSFCEPLEENSEDNSEVNLTTFDPWSGLIEKPVFGEENVNRKRHVNNDFFDDIFKGDENCSSPRKSCYQGSNPGSRTLSPARPLPSKAEPFSTSLPALFSLPSELSKAKVSPGLAYDDGITNKNEDAISNGKSSPVLSKASFSKFLNRAIRGKHVSRGDQYRQSPLSREASVGNLESLDGVNVSNKEDKPNKKNGEDVESPIDGSQFHFSIHKWAHGEVPLLIPLREGKTMQVEEKSDQIASRNTQTESFKITIKKDDERSNQDRIGSKEVAKEANLDIFHLEVDNVVEHHPVDIQSSMSYNVIEETQRSRFIDRPNNVKKSLSPVQKQPDPVMKPFGVSFSKKVDEQENRKERTNRASEGKKGAKSANFSNEEKNSDAGKKCSKTAMVGKDNDPGSPSISGDILHKTGVKGKVRDFVKIFRQETAERSKVSSNNQSQSSRWTGRENYRVDNEVKFSNKITDEVEAQKTDGTLNAFRKMDESPMKDEVKQPSSPKIPNHRSSRYTEQKEASFFTEL